jgi:carbon monoxide dehydrogenase subunit G
MKLENEFTVEVPVEDVWEVLLDLERVTPCLPGAALTEESGNEYKGEMKVRLGPVSQEYEGTVKIEEADEQARRAILGSATPDSASAGERAFLAQAAATVANENARGLVDGEGGQIVRKPQGFADRVLFWRGRGEAPASEQAAPLSPEEEAERIEAVAGSGTVVIPRPRTVRQRLPGI